MLAALELGNEDQLAYCLEIYDALCDKNDITIEFSLQHIGNLLDNSEYWVRQEALAILKKIFRVVEINKFDSIIEKCEAKLFDPDKKVRESAVNLIAEVLKNFMGEVRIVTHHDADGICSAAIITRALAKEGKGVILNL